MNIFPNWKTGRNSPDLNSLLVLSKTYGVPIEYFLKARARRMKDNKDDKWKELMEGLLELIVFMSGFMGGVLIFLKHFVN